MPVFRLSVATAAPDTGVFPSASTRGQSTRPPSRACMAAIAWPSPSRWLEPAGAGAGAHSHGAGRSCTSSQLNTHITESREVWYPWHPWYGRSVVISEVLERLGQAIVRCRLAQGHETQVVEIPSWMLDRAMSSTIHLAQKPVVCSDALWTLKGLLDHQRAVEPTRVLQDQHHFSPTQGDADAQITPSSSQRAADVIPPASSTACLAAVPDCRPAGRHKASRPAPASSPPRIPRQHRRSGGGR